MWTPFGRSSRSLAAGALLAGVLAGGVTAQAQNEGSTLPPAAGQPADPKVPGSELPVPPKEPAAAPRPAAQVEIVSLQAGPSRVTRSTGSFITNSPEMLEITAEARVKGRPDLAGAISWQVIPPAGFSLPQGTRLTGPKLVLRLQRKGGNPTGVGPYLSVGVTARVEADGKTSERTFQLTQDARDRLIQEYIDLGRSEVPARDSLMDAAEFQRRFGRLYRSVSFDELNTSRNPATGQKYPAIPITEALVRTLHLTAKAYGRPVQVTSGFRNPVRQLEVHAEVEGSHHQYGRAADLYVPPATVRDGKRVASEQDWLRLASAAIQGGGVWIEPMVSCNVNTDGCHVHLDVRSTAPQSRVFTVRGQVTDPSGNPVPGATVRLAGMPAVTNAEGNYQLKHVLSSPQEELQVEASGRGITRHALTLVENPLQVSVSIPADPNPTLLARLEPGTRDSSGATTLRLVLKNTGLSNAQGVRITATPSGTQASVTQILPADLASIASGSEGAFNIGMTAAAAASLSERIEVPLQLKVTYTTPKGEAREQSWALTAQLDPAPASAAPEAAPVPASTPRTSRVIQSPARGGVDLSALFFGLIAGCVAGAASVAVRPRHAAADAPAAAEEESAASPEPPAAAAEIAREDLTGTTQEVVPREEPAPEPSPAPDIQPEPSAPAPTPVYWAESPERSSAE